jgi:transcription elongation GreA/GreB family factor
LSRAFVKDETVADASQTVLPDRPISPHPNLVTEKGLQALESELQRARDVYAAANKIEDAAEKARLASLSLRDVRYYSERLRTAQLVAHTSSFGAVSFGNTVTFRDDGGRTSTYCIVGEDEADPGAGLISYISPVAQGLMGKPVGAFVSVGSRELEILATS